ncbi:alpha/beta-hydrolase [Exidia glandulosa HHB12029]|uniref:carboxypeptidase C n=1 Tax=Exidia glandulosa HHB12029 TaxID=1314781 RepID=A0A165C1R4_EXIGL|nr:alpha/beta-hydrolase [Exidia glandulosa HHB12029]
MLPSFPSEKELHLPVPVAAPAAQRARSWSLFRALVVVVGLVQLCRFALSDSSTPAQGDGSGRAISTDSFFWTRNDASSLCPGERGNASYSGYIGLNGDSDDSPRRSFYWFFEAQVDPENAPVVLTIGGGPGSSGLLNPLFGQSHCTVRENGTVPNPNAWSENVNVLALDHPIGVGYSYGLGVDNSRDAAHDVYDFLQKWFAVNPQYSRNNFVVASGSYGGTYVPHIATVIHEHNKELAVGRGPVGAQHINLEALMLSNPMSDARSWFTWHLQQACYNTDLYNATQCAHYFSILPQCLEGIELAYSEPTLDNRVEATQFCLQMLIGDTHGRTTDNIKHKCTGDALECNPEFGWAVDLLNSTETKEILGVPQELTFTPVNVEVNQNFSFAGDHTQQAFRLYEPLLRDGIRILHYIGKLDTIVGWPSTLSFLRLMNTQFSEEFRTAPDIPWPSEDIATVRAIGPGAGNFTLVFMAEAGHFVTKDQPALAKKIMQHWVANEPWFKS